MDRLFRIDFYPAEWILDTARLTPEERGIYIQIVALIYAQRGPVLNDPVWIAGVSGCSPRFAAAMILRLIQKKFITLSGDFLSQKRTEKELGKKRKHFENILKTSPSSSEKQPELNKNKDLEKQKKSPIATAKAPTKAIAPADISRTEAEMLFNTFWEVYPGHGKFGERGGGYKGSKQKASDKFFTLLKKENDHEQFLADLIAGARLYTLHLERSGYCSKHAITWLNQGCWRDDYHLESTGGTMGDAIAQGFAGALHNLRDKD